MIHKGNIKSVLPVKNGCWQTQLPGLLVCSNEGSTEKYENTRLRENESILVIDIVYIELTYLSLFKIVYIGTRLESIILVFLVFLCSHVHLLNYRSELAQICRQDTCTDTIHDQYQKYFNASIVGVVVGW